MMLLSIFYLHSQKIMHRDLKPENFLIDKLPNGIILLKVCDFGLSKNFEEIKERRNLTCEAMTTPAYISPEV